MPIDDIETDVLAVTGADLETTYPNSRYQGQIHDRFELPARDERCVPASGTLPPELARKLEFDPWCHQAEALDALANDENVCVATSTASGKTYVYALHIARQYLADPDTRALIVYPTKALSRDQERELNDLLRNTLGLDITIGVYDGDTKSEAKSRIRENATVVITNFVGLNQYLESHHLWADFHSNCSLVVIDEAHMWTGLSGMHVAWILRRARRIIDWYGGDPQYVLTTATIGNPSDHARALTGEPATVVDDDGSPSGRRDLVFWDPPMSGNEASGERGADIDPAPLTKRPASVEAPEVWAHLCHNDVQSLLFCGSRKLTELAVDRATSFLRSTDLSAPGATDLEAYNAGHGKKSRRSTEHRLKKGILDGVATTSALEVGINVGGVDGTVLMGYPGSRQSFWQRLGRSGRDTRDALSVFVPSHSTLDQYILHHPEYVLEEDHESAVVDLENNPVYLQHINCAAQELPLTRSDADRFGGEERLERAVEYGHRMGDLDGSLAGGVMYAHRDRPQDDISLYASGGNTFDVRLAGDDTIDHQPIGRDRAYRDYHEGATVLYQGAQYQVTDLREDLPQPYIELEQVDVGYYTQSQGQVHIYDTDSRESRDVGSFKLNWGYGTVSIHYSTYLKRELDSGDVREIGLETDLPPLEMRTQLCWAEVPDDFERAMYNKHSDYHNPECVDLPSRLHGYLGGIHAVEHAMIAVSPLELRVDADDLGGLATNRLPEDPETSGWFIYDGIEGGLGFSRSIYDEFEAVAKRAHDLIVDCPCGRVGGCPACTMDDRCGNDNKPLYSPAATDVLARLLGEIDDDEVTAYLPTHEDEMKSHQGDELEGREEPRPPASIS
ncbi:DEAD/DEAH box helicase [Halopenitus sp. H-Gu1]|uniref:DEAD/DEAH box helicase n=1 Tax=Halopenitus sp. H-Gu1 TaxID=3242697 RepID=UPI00359D64AB